MELSRETNRLIDELLQKMTLDEKCSLLSGKDCYAWKHIRPQADFIYYLLKVLDYERSMGVDRPNWLEAARGGLDTFCNIFFMGGFLCGSISPVLPWMATIPVGE